MVVVQWWAKPNPVIPFTTFLNNQINLFNNSGFAGVIFAKNYIVMLFFSDFSPKTTLQCSFCIVFP